MRALYVAPHNLARRKATRQSSTYAKRTPAIAVNGKKSGKGERRCTHTQLDPQAWWEVDLGQLCVIERIVVWNRTDKPEDETRPRDEYTSRLFPFWVFVSQTEFSDLVGGKSFALAHRQSCELKKFTKNRRKTTWNLPSNTIGRFVRIQLEKQNYLHIAEVEVFGRTGTRLGVSQVSSVKCGNCTTIAVVKPRVDKSELEAAYKAAVRADADAAFVLRRYPIYFEQYVMFIIWAIKRVLYELCRYLSFVFSDVHTHTHTRYDKWKRGENIMKCTMCRGRTKCPVCQLLTTWPLSENELELIRKGDGPINRRPGLKYIGNLIVNQPPPKLDWETPKRRKPNTSQACLVS